MRRDERLVFAWHGVAQVSKQAHRLVVAEQRVHRSAGARSVLLEAPQSEMVTTAIIAEVKKAIPNKPIKYVINTHTHSDHSGGLRAAAWPSFPTRSMAVTRTSSGAPSFTLTAFSPSAG